MLYNVVITFQGAEKPTDKTQADSPLHAPEEGDELELRTNTDKI